MSPVLLVELVGGLFDGRIATTGSLTPVIIIGTPRTRELFDEPACEATWNERLGWYEVDELATRRTRGA